MQRSPKLGERKTFLWNITETLYLLNLVPECLEKPL